MTLSGLHSRVIVISRFAMNQGYPKDSNHGSSHSVIPQWVLGHTPFPKPLLYGISQVLRYLSSLEPYFETFVSMVIKTIKPQ